MAEACRKWVDSLNPEQKAKATYHYLDGERQFWYYPPLNRHGLPLRDMTPEQRDLAYGIMESSLDAQAYEQAKAIIDHELILGPLEKERGIESFVRDPMLYYWTVFGEPGGEEPWGWRAEGHHVSLHFSVWGEEVTAVTPFFFGANPAEVPHGPEQGKRILGDREDLAIELMATMTDEQRAKAIIHENAPWDILTYNTTKAPVHQGEGLSATEMTGEQKEILLALITEYVNQVRTDVAHERLEAIKENGLDHFRLVWAGATDRSRDHYYRIHGGNFLIEFDNIQDGANHIHSVWRDVENDFANDVLRDHRLMFHVL
ncbi:hypothetical protein GBAR_LOCUS20573 [Geodia barretti]|uniref:DUF3500 domain-containing protein n=1 Tax=Geodia barretti TaxID=519541 RepID=A0AA35WWS4_GEOBA|nr:hypothetical protein GBAR_LOCUS20573 [Geodia barretti]